MSMAIEAIVMPKWGLAMEEGALTEWGSRRARWSARDRKSPTSRPRRSPTLSKARRAGRSAVWLRPRARSCRSERRLRWSPTRRLPDSEIDAFIAKFQAEFTPKVKAAGGGPLPNHRGGRLTLRALTVGEGAGTPVVPLHGFGSDLASWLFTQEAARRRSGGSRLRSARPWRLRRRRSAAGASPISRRRRSPSMDALGAR